jgi:uncharacterized protein YoaH (UPF0181 family)
MGTGKKRMKLRQLFENRGNSVGVCFGRWNPPHKGHKAAWEIAASFGTFYVGTNKNTEGPNDPLPYEVKLKAMETIWPEIAGHVIPEQSLFTLVSKIFAKHGEHTHLKVATDEEWLTKSLIQYNGKEGAHGYYKFASIEQVPTPRLSSATALRAAVRAGDRDAFSDAAGVDADTPIKIGKKTVAFFDLVAHYLAKHPEKAKKVKKVAEHKKGVRAMKYTKKPVNPSAQHAKAKEKLAPIKPGVEKQTDECAGVGTITKQNSTGDVNKGTPYKNLKAFNLVKEGVDMRAMAEKAKQLLAQGMSEQQAIDQLVKQGLPLRYAQQAVQAAQMNEGEVVKFPKKHRGDISDMRDCPKCGGDLQGGKYMGHQVQVCMPCKQVYLPPNSGIDKHGNKVDEIAGAFPSPSTREKWAKDAAASNAAEAKRLADIKAKADAERLRVNNAIVDKEQRINYHPMPDNEVPAKEGAEERNTNRTWAQITDYEKRAKATSNDIKKQHYLKMADELRAKLPVNEVAMRMQGSSQSEKDATAREKARQAEEKAKHAAIVKAYVDIMSKGQPLPPKMQQSYNTMPDFRKEVDAALANIPGRPGEVDLEQRRNYHLLPKNEAFLQHLESEMLAETGMKKIEKSTKGAMKNAMTLPALNMNSGSMYTNYRFGLALAGAPNFPTKMEADNWIGGDPLLSTYTEEEFEMVKAAAKQVGAGTIQNWSGKRSEEMADVNKTSTVAKIKRNKYGV